MNSSIPGELHTLSQRRTRVIIRLVLEDHSLSLEAFESSVLTNIRYRRRNRNCRGIPCKFKQRSKYRCKQTI